MSTDYVFSGDSTTPWNENTLTSPISIYGASKAKGEKLVLNEYPENSYIVRTAWLYSPWGRNFVKSIAQKAISGEKDVKVVSNQVGQPTSALDLATHVLAMITNQVTPGIYHGTNSGQTSWYELAKLIFTHAGRNGNCIVPIDSSHFTDLARRPNYSVLGFDNWLREGMHPMRNWEDALESTIPFVLQEIANGRSSI
jgi:dTDP-4-dehydrorhamnose reductase